MARKPIKKTIRARPKSFTLTMPRQSVSAYEKDFYKWAIDQAKFLKRKEFSKLDIENLTEEILALSRSEKRDLEGRMVILLQHLLKQKYLEGANNRSLENSIIDAQENLNEAIEENPSLKRQIPKMFEEAYDDARFETIRETGLDAKIFPEKCPWSFEECMKARKI